MKSEKELKEMQIVFVEEIVFMKNMILVLPI